METTPATNTPEKAGNPTGPAEGSRTEAENPADGESIFTADLAQRVVSTDETLPAQGVTDEEAQNISTPEGSAPSGDLINNTGSDQGTNQADADAASG